jgi:exodeoxyribonuclease VII small subunit
MRPRGHRLQAACAAPRSGSRIRFRTRIEDVMNAKKKTEPSFEEALAELETLVERMEDGELSLEESIKTYERGVALGRSALKALDAAEQRVRILNENVPEPQPLDAGDPDADPA